WLKGRSRERGKWLARRARACENSSRAIAVVNVAIHGHGGADFVIALHAADGDRHVVNHAEALAMVGEGVVESAADVEGDSILQRILSSQDGPARRQPEAL